MLTCDSCHEVPLLFPVPFRLAYQGNRELYMKTGQGFLLVFSITSLSSLNELSELREQIIRIKDDENVPIVIVGNKSDLEEDRVVTRQKAFTVSQSWGNAPYYETSARRRGESKLYSLAEEEGERERKGTKRRWMAKNKTANVDEVFIDLCRQIIRKDNTAATSFDDDYGYTKVRKPRRVKHGRSPKRGRKDRCAIL